MSPPKNGLVKESALKFTLIALSKILNTYQYIHPANTGLVYTEYNTFHNLKKLNSNPCKLKYLYINNLITIPFLIIQQLRETKLNHISLFPSFLYLALKSLSSRLYIMHSQTHARQTRARSFFYSANCVLNPFIQYLSSKTPVYIHILSLIHI